VDTEGEVEAVEEDLVAVVGEVDIVMKARLKKLLRWQCFSTHVKERQ